MLRSLCVCLALANPAFAQHVTPSEHGVSNLPGEVGQSAFAALGETVALLRADPKTDWVRVDLPALVRHLRDMDALVLNSSVAWKHLPDGIEMTLDDLPDNAAARRMVQAHAPVLASETGWASQIVRRDAQIVWVVRGTQVQQIQALGFFGLMTLGSHHPVHHLAIARGQSVH